MSYFRCRIKNEQMTLVECFCDKGEVVFPDTFEGVNITVMDARAIQTSTNNMLVDAITLPKYLETIGNNVFFNFQSLKKVELPDTMKEIKSLAFLDCVSLEEIIFPESMEKVGSSAFSNCCSLKKIVVKNPAMKFTSSTFEDCTALEDVSFDVLKSLSMDIQCKIVIKRLHDWEELTQEEQEELLTYLKKKAALRKEIFLSGDVVVVSFLMSQKTKLTLEMVEEFLAKSIAENNTEVTAIFLDYKNKNFTKNVQEDYNANKELVEIGLELPTMKQFKAKWKCSKVEGGLTVSDYKGSETHETIPTKLADGTRIVAFQKKTGAKYGAISLGTITHLTIEAPISSLKENSFQYSQLQSITLPDSLEDIGKFTFLSCKKLKSIVLPPNLNLLPQNIFSSCESLKKITIPETVEKIGAFAFVNCIQLENVIFPDNIQEIEEYAFDVTPLLKEVTLPRGVKLGKNAFDAAVTINWK